jgi:glycosyltransferase involved in cell wall biosynthesis
MTTSAGPSAGHHAAGTASAAPRFTVLTPTYNRAGTLPRVYASLLAQTSCNLEWVVVDDGSEDETEALVRGWMVEAPFPIRYLRQANAGKPAAVNRGIAEARGFFTLVLDSDDACVPHAIETFERIWAGIPAAERPRYSGVAVLAVTPDGELVGSTFPGERLDAHPHDVALRHGVRGEKWGFHRTALLREALYPITPGERWMPEALMWNRISRRYLVRHENVALRVYEPNADGITARIRELMLGNPTGVSTYYGELLTLGIPLRWRFGAAVRYVRYGLHVHASPLRLIRGSGAPWTTAIALPLGSASWLLDRVRGTHRRGASGLTGGR